MLRRLGYACLSVERPDLSPRGVQLRNASPERLRELIYQNLTHLAELLRFNVERNIRFFRISAEIIPFASHPVNTIPWWDEFSDELARIAAVIQEHDVRVSTHVGPYTTLSAANPGILAASIRDLEYQARFLDALSPDPRHKIVIHGGGVYGDQAAAMEHWCAVARGLPGSIRARLTIENDERLYGADAALALARCAKLPWVFDVFHHRVFTGSDSDVPMRLEQAFSTWTHDDGIPKIHFSSQGAGQRAGAHAEHIDPEEFRQFLAMISSEMPFDCMLEAKAKDRALLELRDGLGLEA